MHGGTHNHNPSVKAVRLAIKKNILLSLDHSLDTGNCIRDYDAPLLPGDSISQCEPATLSPDAALHDIEEYTDDDSISTDVDIDINIDELSKSVCSLESCALEYFAGYIAKKVSKSRGVIYVMSHSLIVIVAFVATSKY